MPSRPSLPRGSALECVYGLAGLAVASGLALATLTAARPELQHLSPAANTFLLAGALPLTIKSLTRHMTEVANRQRQLAKQERLADHKRFVQLEREERQRTKELCDVEHAAVRRREQEALAAVEDRRSEISRQEFLRALEMLQPGALDEIRGGVVRRLPRSEDAGQSLSKVARGNAVTDSGGHKYDLS